MSKFLVDLWLDGYEDESERTEAELEFIKDQLNMTASSVDAISLPYSPVKFFVREDVYIENRDPENRFPNKPAWVVTKHGCTLNSDMEFEYEPMPSSRDDEYISRTRFTLAAAIDYAKKLTKK
jgi:hypothetical protein